jgi:hypothetical protein
MEAVDTADTSIKHTKYFFKDGPLALCHFLKKTRLNRVYFAYSDRTQVWSEKNGVDFEPHTNQTSNDK